MPSRTSRHGECSAKKAVVTELRWTSTPACSKPSSGYSSLRPMNKPPGLLGYDRATELVYSALLAVRLPRCRVTGPEGQWSVDVVFGYLGDRVWIVGSR